MPKLVALELTNGQELFDAIAAVEASGDAFCVLDPRDSHRRRRDVLSALTPTHLRDASGTRAVPDGRPVSDGDGAVVLTSGSSGQPKATVITWSALRSSATLTSEALTRHQRVPRWWVNLTPVHIGGLATYLRCLFTEVDPIFSPSLDAALGEGATHVSVVRTQLVRADYSPFDVVLLGGGPPPTQVPSNVVATYGMTETGSGVVYDGRPLRDVHVQVVDGEIHLCSPTLFRAYRHGEDPTYHDSEGRRWLPTGDGGSFDGTQLVVHGRLDYVITTGGEKVWPDDLETLFREIPGVDDVAVIGVPDHEWGQRVVMACVTSAPEDEVLHQAQELARESIARWAAPKEIRTVSEIPRTSNGKVARHELEQLLA